MSTADEALSNIFYYLLYDHEELNHFETMFEEECPEEYAKYEKYLDSKKDDSENHLDELVNYMFHNEDDFVDIASHTVYDYYVYRREMGTIPDQQKKVWKFKRKS